ncbi:gastrula zinc finger protein XlCGF8.2DB-like [Anopheles bellator]|uniref:gastrula zinc finger protein XlCGF8.2DB-like n=1 Tax=Anopheles bellator TaxID=139047 RepID=UPI002647F36B|nr:gastrula zinc finger protein XlCGF8.2DB-like [Anopheles bellator]
MATSKPSKDSFSTETTRICRNCLSTDGTFQPVTSDERGEYLSQQVFSCTNVQMELLPGSTTYLCSACKSRLNFADKRRSIYTLNIAKLDRIMKELKIHIRTHNRKKPFICKVCSKAFHSENTLIIHMKIHNKDQHKCPHCPGKFARPCQLKDHIRIHTGEKPFHCNVCSKKFHAARNLHIHMKIHNKDQHKCPHCPGKFARPSQLKDHIRTHTGEKPFICKVCSKAFHSASVLCIHKTIHNKDQHNCPHCSSEFALQYQLKNHIRTHTDEKPFTCKVCSKEFHSAVNLYSHMKIHDKAQQCPYCDRKFAQQYQLKTHIRIHTGEKPCHCNVCSKKFHAAINLHNHMKIHNKDQHKYESV